MRRRFFRRTRKPHFPSWQSLRRQLLERVLELFFPPLVATIFALVWLGCSYPSSSPLHRRFSRLVLLRPLCRISVFQLVQPFVCIPKLRLDSSRILLRSVCNLV